MAVSVVERLSKQELREKEFFGYLSEGVIVEKGKAGSGKTITAVSIAHNLSKYYGKPVILDFHAKPEFGPYTYMGSREFLSELKKVGKIAKEGVGEVAEGIRKKLGIKFDDAVIVWDEAYKYLDSRRPSDMMTLTYGYYLQQWRHYHSTVILCTPRLDMIDAKRALNQVTVELGCSANFKVTPMGVIGPKNPREWKCTARGIDRFTLQPVKLVTPVWKYGGMYDSWAPIAIRKKMLTKVELQ